MTWPLETLLYCTLTVADSNSLDFFFLTGGFEYIEPSEITSKNNPVSSARNPPVAHFSDRERLFQVARGPRFSALVDAQRMRASEGLNVYPMYLDVSQSSTINLKRTCPKR